MRRRAWLALALVVTGCGGGRPAAVAPASPAEQPYGALAWVPPDVTWAVVGGRAGDVVGAVREALEPLAIAVGGEVGGLDRDLARSLGGSPLVVGDLDAAGLDLDGGVALFGQPGGFVTAMVAIGDRERLLGYLERQRPAANVSSTLHHGHELYAWTPAAGVEVVWSVLDGWLVVHLGPAGQGTAWLDAILAAPSGRGLADEADFTAALARGRGLSGAAMPTALGLVRVGALVAELAPHLGDGARCLVALGGSVTSLSLAGHLDGEVGGLEIALGLTPGAAAALRRGLGPAPLPGLVAYRERSAFHAGLGLDLDWLDGVRRAAGCGTLLPAVADPLRAATGRPGAGGYYVAAEAIDLDDLDGRGAVQLGLRDSRVVADMLDAIPGRSFLERDETVAGVAVKVLDGLPGVPTLAYRLTDDAVVAAVGDGVMPQILGTGAAPAPGRELAAAGLEPGRLAGLGRLLAAAGRAAGMWIDGDQAERAARRLMRYRALGGRVVLDGDTLVLGAAMRLRR